MDRRFFVVIPLFMIVFIGPAYSTGDAVFGLRWGDSPTLIRQSGITLKKLEDGKNISLYRADSLPKNFPTAEKYTLLFEGDTSLVKIIMLSKTILEDPDGSKGRTSFDAICDMIGKKNAFAHGFCAIRDSSEPFYPCLAARGCGSWIKIFKSPNKSISVALRGVTSESGYIIISAEAIPEFEIAVENSKSNPRRGSLSR